MARKSTIISTAAFFIPIVMSIPITTHKFQLAKERPIEISLTNEELNKVEENQDVILFPDEITYLTWLSFRSENIDQFLSGNQGLSINLYGYPVSFLYLLVRDWRILFVFGYINYLLFFYSCVLLLKGLEIPDRGVSIALLLICLSPTVINLVSGFLRDLLIMAAVNISFYSCIRRRPFLAIMSLFGVLFLRASMLYVLFFIYLLAYFSNSRRYRLIKEIAPLAFILMSVFLIVIIGKTKGGYSTTLIDVFARIVEVLFGINKVIINLSEIGHARGAILVEILAHIYQMTIIVFLYCAILATGKMRTYTIAFIGASIMLAVLYGSYLGFFVARTKMIQLWLYIVSIVMLLFGQSTAVTIVNESQQKIGVVPRTTAK